MPIFVPSSVRIDSLSSTLATAVEAGFGIGVFGMKRDDVRAGICELVDLVHKSVIRHHQVNMDRPVRQRPDLSDQIREQQHGGRKMTIRDIGVIDVDEFIHPRHVIRHAHQVGRP